MITRIYANNYRCLIDFELRPGAMTVLLGEHGAGKSTVLELLLNLHALILDYGHAPMSDFFSARTRTRWANTDAVQHIELDVELDGEAYRYELDIASRPDTDDDMVDDIVIVRGAVPDEDVEDDLDDQRVHIKREAVLCNGRPLAVFADGDMTWFDEQRTVGDEKTGRSDRSLFAARDAVEQRPRLEVFYRFFANMEGVGPELTNMNAFSGEETSSPGYFFGKFGSWYRYLERKEPVQVAVFNRELATVLPEFVTLRIAKMDRRDRRLMAVFKGAEDQSSPVEYEFDELAGGEQILIALYSIVHFMVRPGAFLTLSDMPESYLAPAELQRWFERLHERVRATDAQVLLSVRNPDAIAGLPDDVALWLRRANTGPTELVSSRA